MFDLDMPDLCDSNFQIKLVALVALVLISILISDFLKIKKWNRIAFTPVKELGRYYAVAVSAVDPTKTVRFWSGYHLSIDTGYYKQMMHWGQVAVIQVCFRQTGQPIYSIRKVLGGFQEEVDQRLLNEELLFEEQM